MKHTDLRRRQPADDNKSPKEAREPGFYEAIPGVRSDGVFTDNSEPMLMEDDADQIDSMQRLSGWAVLGIILLAILVLVLLFGRGLNLPNIDRPATPISTPLTT